MPLAKQALPVLALSTASALALLVVSPVLVVGVALSALAVRIALGSATRRNGSRAAACPPRDLVRRALAVIPAADDRTALLRTVVRLLDTDQRVDVAVVEAAAPGVEAVERVSQRMTVLRRHGADDPGAALKHGAAHGLAADYDAVIEISPGHSRLARRITSLLDALDDGAHVAIGSRYVPGGRVVGEPRHRRLGSRALNLTLRRATAVPVADVTAHVRAYRRSAIEEGVLPAAGHGRAVTVDALLRCWRAGMSVREVPVTATGPTDVRTSLSSVGRLVAHTAAARRRLDRESRASRRVLDVGDAASAAAR